MIEELSRRNLLKLLTAGSLAAVNGMPKASAASLGRANLLATGHEPAQADSSGTADMDRQRRMQWWHQAKFGMFIHWVSIASSAAMSGSWKTRAFPFPST